MIKKLNIFLVFVFLIIPAVLFFVPSNMGFAASISILLVINPVFMIYLVNASNTLKEKLLNILLANAIFTISCFIYYNNTALSYVILYLLVSFIALIPTIIKSFKK